MTVTRIPETDAALLAKKKLAGLAVQLVPLALLPAEMDSSVDLKVVMTVTSPLVMVAVLPVPSRLVGLALPKASLALEYPPNVVMV